MERSLKLSLVILAGIAIFSRSEPVWAMTPPSICQISDLRLSPSGRFVYAPLNWYNLVLYDVSCLKSQPWDACSPLVVATKSDLGFLGFAFQDQDKYVSFYSRATNESGLATSTILAEKVAIRPNKNNADYERKEFPSGVHSDGNALGYLVLAKQFRYQNIERFFRATSTALKLADQHHTYNSAANARDIFGFASADQYFIFKRDNAFRVTAFAKNTNGRPQDLPGIAFDRDDLPSFAIDGNDAIMATLGSVIRVSPQGELTSDSSGRPRARLIDTGADDQYVGYFTNDAIIPATRDPFLSSLAQRVDGSGKYLAHVTVLPNRKLAVVSFLNNLPATDSGALSYRHEIQSNNEVVSIDCGKSQNFTFSIQRLSSRRSTWVKSFSTSGATDTVLFLHGGPYRHEEPTTSTALRYFLAHGLNVNVIEFGGQNYTLETAQLLSSGGYGSLNADARDVEAYSRAFLNPARTHLYATSFGAHLFTRLSPGFVNGFRSLVLDLPSGTIAPDLNNDTPTISAMNRQIMGDEIIIGNLDNAYFAALKDCPISRRAMIIYNDEDDRVFPEADYATCAGSDGVEFIEDVVGHNTSPLQAGFDSQVFEHYARILKFMRR